MKRTLILLAFFWLSSLSTAAPPKELHGPVPVVKAVPGEPFLHAGPMVGHVTDTQAHLWAKASNDATLAFKISESPDLSDAKVTRGISVNHTTSFTGQVVAEGLKPNTSYFYVPLLNGKSAMQRPYPKFVTALPSDKEGRLRVAFGSCVGPRGYNAAAAFGEMAARGNFDVLLMLGDNHYGDTTNPDLLRDYYFMQRTVDGFAKIIREKPTYAIWDDHDYGPNNSDGTAKGKEDSLHVFQQWWANPAYGEPDNPGCYYTFHRNGVDFFMLDVRYYRTPNRIKEDGKKTMLGSHQLAWLKKKPLLVKSQVQDHCFWKRVANLDAARLLVVLRPRTPRDFRPHYQEPN